MLEETILRFIQLAQEQKGCGYAFGAQGEILTPEGLEKLIAWAHGDRSKFISDTKDARKWYGIRVFDCSGYVLWLLQQLGLLPTDKDYTANQIFRDLCIPIEQENLRPGDLCFSQASSGEMGHVAIYLSPNKVIHARGTRYGVVETEMFKSFTFFGRLKMFMTEGDKMKEEIKDFQRRYGLTATGVPDARTKQKAVEVQRVLDAIEAYKLPTYEYYKYGDAHVIEVDPLTLRHQWFQGNQKKRPKELVKSLPNFVNCMFYDGEHDILFRLLIQDGKVLSEIKSYDKWPDKGTFIVYNDGRVEVKTVGREALATLPIAQIKLAFQGFNLDYEANGSTNLRDSMRKEGWGQSNDYIYSVKCLRPGFGYNRTKKKVIIAVAKTDAKGLRTLMRNLGCKTESNDTCALGGDSGGSIALAVDGKLLVDGDRTQVSVLTF
jgi:hypothetical protein